MAATRRTRNRGGVTPFRSAQSNFCRSEKQQHLSQHTDAVAHPHGQFMHGNGSDVRLVLVLVPTGTPDARITQTTSSHPATIRREVARRGRMDGIVVLEPERDRTQPIVAAAFVKVACGLGEAPLGWR